MRSIETGRVSRGASCAGDEADGGGEGRGNVEAGDSWAETVPADVIRIAAISEARSRMETGTPAPILDAACGIRPADGGRLQGLHDSRQRNAKIIKGIVA